MIRLSLLFALLGSLLFANQAFSHQEKASITQVLLNSRSGHLEIAHRFYIHDAEHAVKFITGKAVDIFDSEETQTTFYQYVISHFDLVINNQSLKLKALGFEMEGAYFWAYQEIALPDESLSGKTVEVRHSSLQEFWPDQINRVNFESTKGAVVTAILTAGNPTESLQL